MLPTIEAPTYSLILPSTKKEIKYRPFLVKEEKLLLTALEQDGQGKQTSDLVVSTLKQIINNCTFNKVDIDSLTTFDLEYLFVMLRAKSKGESVKIGFRCTEILKDDQGNERECGHVTNVDYDLTKIEVFETEGHTKKIMLTDTIGMTMRYPDFETFSKVNFTEVEGQAASIVNDVILKCIDNVFNGETVTSTKDVSKEELERFLEQLSSPQMEKIQQFFASMPRVQAKLSYTCKCGKKQEDITITGLQDFLT